MLPCRECGRREYLVFGWCVGCRPRIHAEHQAALDAYDKRAVAYHAATGKHPMDDFDAFEQWDEGVVKP